MSWFSFKKKAEKKVFSRKRHERSFEILEKRQVLAGLVDYIFASGNLELKADGAGNNSIEIFRSGNNYFLRSNNGDTFVNKTPPNVDPFPTFTTPPDRALGIGPLNKITIDLGEGSDTVYIHGDLADPTRNFIARDVVDIKMGTGDDTVTLDITDFLDRFTYAGDAGVDGVAVTRARFRGNATLDSGDGIDTISFIGTLPVGAVTARPIVFDENLSVDMGGGGDTFIAQFFQAENNFTVATGDGIDSVTIGGLEEAPGDLDAIDSGRQSTIRGVLSVDLGSAIDDLSLSFMTVEGNTSISTGADSDTVNIRGSDDVETNDGPNDTSTTVKFFGTVSIDLGTGTNSLDIFYARFESSLSITGGANADSISIEGRPANTTPLVVVGAVNIDLGDGGNNTSIIYANFGASLSIKGGTGSDSVNFFGDLTIGFPVTVFSSVTVDLGNGSNNMTLTYVDIGSALTYTGGSDADNVIITGDVPTSRRSHIGGDITISLGNGGNSVSITYSDFDNSISITGGTGTDTVDTSGSLFDDMPLFIDGNVLVNLGDGSNSYTASYVDFNGNFTYVGGAGTDTVLIQGFLGAGLSNNHPSEIEGNVSITLGGSNDTTNILYVLIAGNFSLTAGDGLDTVNVRGLLDPEDPLDPLDTDTVDWGEQGSVGGTFTADMGTGNDRLVVTYITIGGNTTLIGGDGNDTIIIAGSIDIATADNPDNVPNNTDIEDDDLADTSTWLEIDGSLTVNLGDGTNTLTGINVSATGGLNITGGANVDTILLNGTVGSTLPLVRATRQFIIGGATSITLGAGNDSLRVLGLVFGGGVTLDAGAGNDTVVFSGMPDTPKVGNPPVFSDPDAVDSGIQGTIDGTFQAILGDGNDSLLLDYLALSGNVIVSAGNGNDTVRMAGQDDVELDNGFGLPFAFSVVGAVVVDLGAGTNALVIDYLIAGGGLQVTGGTGSDSVIIRGYPDKIPDNGADDTLSTQFSTSNAGNFIIILGAGADYVEIYNIQVAQGGVNIFTEDGGDTLIIGRLTSRDLNFIDTGLGADNAQIDDMSTTGGGSFIQIITQAGADKLIANFIVTAGSIFIDMGADSDEIELGHLGEVGTGFDTFAQTTITVNLGTATANSGIDSVKMDGVGANGEITVNKGAGGQSEMYLDFVTTNAGITLNGHNETDTIRLFRSGAITHFNITTFNNATVGTTPEDGNDLVYISASDVTGGGISVRTGLDDDHVEIGLYVPITQLLAPGFIFFFDGDLDGDGVFDGGIVSVRDDIVVDSGFVNTRPQDGILSGSDYVFVGWSFSRLGDFVCNTGDSSDKIEIYNVTFNNVILDTSDADPLNDFLDTLADDIGQIGYLTTRQQFSINTGYGNDLVSFYASRLIGEGFVNAGEDSDTVATVVQQYQADFSIQMLTGYNTLICDNVISTASFYYAATFGTGNATVKNSQAVRMNLTLGNDADIATVTNNTFTNLFVSMGSGDDWLTVIGNYLPYELTVIGGEGRGDRLTMIGNAPRTTSIGFEAFY